jgi:hypothetical protein
MSNIIHGANVGLAKIIKPRGPYFVGGDGHYYPYYLITARVAQMVAKFPHLNGAHIRVQLDAIGILPQFESGSTSFPLPYSFYELKQGKPLVFEG